MFKFLRSAFIALTLLGTAGSGATAGDKVITLEQLNQMFADMRAGPNYKKWNVDGDLLWGYFFTDRDAKKLQPVADHLTKAGYRYQPATVDGAAPPPSQWMSGKGWNVVPEGSGSGYSPRSSLLVAQFNGGSPPLHLPVQQLNEQRNCGPHRPFRTSHFVAIGWWCSCLSVIACVAL